MLQRLQSKAMIRKMETSVDSVGKIAQVADKEVVDLRGYLQDLPGKPSQQRRHIEDDVVYLVSPYSQTPFTSACRTLTSPER